MPIDPVVVIENVDEALSIARALLDANLNVMEITFDLNYRNKLWKYGKKAEVVMQQLMSYVDIVIANEEDCQKSLGICNINAQ